MRVRPLLLMLIAAGTSCGGLILGAERDGGTSESESGTCSSNSVSNGQSDLDMNPGLACLGCHRHSNEAPAFVFCGTVFLALHERDQCNAPPPPDGRVEIYDADGGLALTLTPQEASGNFFIEPGTVVALPYTARVVANGRSARMTSPQTDGDCNGCHSVYGARGAPGRVVWPNR